MSIVRDIAFTVKSLEDKGFITCSTALVAGAGGLFSTNGSTANIVQSSAAAAGATYGRVIDRLGDLLNYTRFTVALPATHFDSTRGSTEANRQVSVGVKLQHGDSSGGGDMADFSTGSQPADHVYFSTARTSDMANWDSTGSTGPAYLVSNMAYYDLRPAKRFIRAAHIVTKNRVTSETSGDEGARISGTITFLGADLIPMSVGTKNYTASSTTT